jgi:hypothetical protein
MLGDTGFILPSICDGFTYNPQLRANSENYDIVALGQLELLRRTKGFIPKLYAVPDFTDGAIPNFQTIQQQISVTPGSWLWAVTAISGAAEIPQDNQFFVTIRDDDTGDSLFNYQFIANQTIRPFSTDATSPASGAAFNVQKKLTQPRLISGRGILDVQISATNNFSAVPYQVILCVAQPCDSVLNQDPDLCDVYSAQQS